MQQRQLGQKGPTVSAIGIGCWGMSGAYGAADETEAQATLIRALDRGVSLFDTADVYGEGHNEQLLGRVLKGRRQEYTLATKTGFVTRQRAGTAPEICVDTHPQRIRIACDASLVRLQTDHVDLYYLHRLDPTIAIEESVGAVAELITAGKVRHLGLCEVSGTTLRRAHAVHPVTAVQSEYSLWTRDVETGVLPICRELGIGFVPFSPLGRGFLTASLTATSQLAADDWRSTNPRFSAQNLPRNLTLLQPLIDLADVHGCTPAQIALAWLLSRGDHIIPIPGMKRRSHLDENLQALDVRLDDDELDGLTRAFPTGTAAGSRYNPDHARWIDH